MTDTPDSISRAIEALSTSCLNRARQGDDEAWRRLERTHRQLIGWWCVRSRIPRQDIDDVVQEVLASLAVGDAKLRPSTFRGLLWTITRSRILDYWRQRAKQPAIADGVSIELLLETVEADSSRVTDSGLDQATRIVFDAVVHEVQGNFSELDWQAFWMAAVEARPAADVASELNVSRNQVYLARSRILRHIRLAFDELKNEPDV